MSIRKKIVIVIEKTDSGYSAFAKDYPVYTTGNSMNELINNTVEAFSLYFENKRFDPGLLTFEIDFKQFFQFYKVINAKALAVKIGMNPTLLSQYVRGHKKPSEHQSRKILYGINRIGQELSEMNVIYNKNLKGD